MLLTCEVMDAEKLKTFDQQFSYGFMYCANFIFREVRIERIFLVRFSQNTASFLRNYVMKTVNRSSFLSTAEFSSTFPQFVKVLFILHAADALRSQQFSQDSEILTDFI